MHARVTALTELTAATMPSWLQALRTPPAGAALTSWKADVGVVAAWRDQHAITTESPGHILGPRPEPGTSAEPAWQHATAAITEARKLSRQQPSAATEAREHTTTDGHRALREAQHEVRRERARTASQRHRPEPPVKARPTRQDPRGEDEAQLLTPPPQPQQHDRPRSW